jgi:guanylate cyclase
MEARGSDRSWAARATGGAVALLSLADDPADDDDVRRRKRVGVSAGYLTIVAPLALPLQAGGSALSWLCAIGLSLFSVANLAWLARTRDFERFVVLLISLGVVFVPVASALGGGITGSSPGLVWGFLVPAYAILALGPRRALRWFWVYLALIVFMVVVDPWVRAAVPPASYAVQLFGTVQNAVIPLAIVFLLLRYTDLRRQAAEAQVEELLTNAIPRPIVARLRRGERRIAERYAETTVLFADIVGFTPWAQRTAPERVVELLDGLFSAFDALAERHGLEKIKTIGDAYMAVAGAPLARDDHAAASLAMARDMIESVAEVSEGSGVPLEVRIGLASGPVVGGVIGQRRLLFDLWGDTVNVASRMESSGQPGRIQVAESTRARLEGRAEFEPRTSDVKGLGVLNTYLVL